MANAATTTVDSESGYAQTIETANHQLKADEPTSAGGTDTGPRPTQLLLAALGACTSITLRMYADRKEWQLGHIHVALRLVKTSDGSSRIEREVSFSTSLTDAQRGRLLEIAEKTPVTRIIKSGAAIDTRLL